MRNRLTTHMVVAAMFLLGNGYLTAHFGSREIALCLDIQRARLAIASYKLAQYQESRRNGDVQLLQGLLGDCLGAAQQLRHNIDLMQEQQRDLTETVQRQHNAMEAINQWYKRQIELIKQEHGAQLSRLRDFVNAAKALNRVSREEIDLLKQQHQSELEHAHHLNRLLLGRLQLMNEPMQSRPFSLLRAGNLQEPTDMWFNSSHIDSEVGDSLPWEFDDEPCNIEHVSDECGGYQVHKDAVHQLYVAVRDLMHEEGQESWVKLAQLFDRCNEFFEKIGIIHSEQCEHTITHIER